ncbi:hypothetical protein HK405_010701 [Cladochytrium tenue]|nr:hypothetical protein HK405_010701 [Cladochytrium tenue]
MTADSAAQIKAVSDRIKQLKASGANDVLIKEQLDILQSLKRGSSKGDDASAPRKFELKTPKGTRDFTPDEMAVREEMFRTITSVFKRHGAVTIDTPVFELKTKAENCALYAMT